MSSRSDGFDVVYRPLRGPPRHIRFEPRSDGYWEREEATWNGRLWRRVGTEIVMDVELDAPKHQNDVLPDDAL